jgi:ankyrin repeat protein
MQNAQINNNVNSFPESSQFYTPPLENNMTQKIKQRTFEFNNMNHWYGNVHDTKFMLKSMNKTFLQNSYNYESVLLNKFSKSKDYIDSKDSIDSETTELFNEFIMAFSNDQTDKALASFLQINDITLLDYMLYQQLSICNKDNLDKLNNFIQKCLETSLGKKDGYKVFTTACLMDNMTIVNYLIDNHNVDYNYPGFENNTSFVYAIANNNLELVKLILDNSNIDINKIDSDNIVPIFRTLYNNQIEILKVLLNQPTILVDNLLVETIDMNKFYLIHEIINSEKVDITQLGDKIKLCLTYLLSQKHDYNKSLIKIFEYIDINQKNNVGETYLINCLSKFYNDKIDLFLEYPHIDITITDLEGNNALMVGLNNNNQDGVKKILKYIVSLDTDTQNTILNQKNYLGENCINIICSANNYNNDIVNDIVDLLVDFNLININNKISDGDTPLIFSIIKSNKYLFNKLMECAELDVNMYGKNGTTPLMESSLRVDNDQLGLCDSFYKEMVFRLLNHKNIDINKKNEHGDSMLAMVFKRKNGYYYSNQEPFVTQDGMEPVFADWSYFPNSMGTRITDIELVEDMTKCQSWNLLMFSILLNRNDIDVNTTDKDGDGLLTLSIKYNDKTTFDLITKQPALDINSNNDNGENCLIATMLNNVNNVNEVNNTNKYVNEPIKYINNSMSSDNINMTTMYNPAPFKIPSRDFWKQPIESSKVKSISLSNSNKFNYFFDQLLNNDEFNLNDQDYSGNSLIHLFIRHSYYDLLLKLLTKDIDINITDCFENTPLMYAVQNEIKYYKLLLEKGADKEKINYQGQKVFNFIKSRADTFTFCKVAGISIKDLLESNNETTNIQQNHTDNLNLSQGVTHFHSDPHKPKGWFN